MELKTETHSHESVDKTNNEANLENQRISQTENRAIFSKGEVGGNLHYKKLSKREATYFSQYSNLGDIDASNKRAILNILSEDYKNMTSEEKSHVPESFLKTLEDAGKSARNGQAQSASLDKIPIETSSLRSPLGTATGAKIVGQVKINGQHFDKVECGGGGDCCFRSIAEAIGYGKDNYMKVREMLSKKMIEAANSKDPLPESLRLALFRVIDRLDVNNDNMCKKALKYYAQNVTSKNGEWGELVDLYFVPRLPGLVGKRVFVFDKDSRKTYAGDNKCNGLDEKIKPQKGDVVLFNTGGHWQMLKPTEQKSVQ